MIVHVCRAKKMYEWKTISAFEEERDIFSNLEFAFFSRWKTFCFLIHFPTSNTRNKWNHFLENYFLSDKRSLSHYFGSTILRTIDRDLIKFFIWHKRRTCWVQILHWPISCFPTYINHKLRSPKIWMRWVINMYVRKLASWMSGME